MAEGRYTARAPGRINVIGDHTDYTGGFCLPIAIDRVVEVSGFVDSSSDVIELTSEAMKSTARIPLGIGDLGSLEPEWGRYVGGIVKRIRPPYGFRGTIRSDVPVGTGLSSSAALEVAVALVLGGAAMEPLALAELCRSAEHEARGVPTGLLDQLASICGVEGHGLLIDCASNSVSAVALPSATEAEFVVVEGGSRDLASTGYAERVAELRRVEQQIGPLRNASRAQVEAIGDDTLRRRARHVVTENERVHAFVASVADHDLATAGQLMNESHRSLSLDYESSTAGIDDLCDELGRTPGVLGARITGGGWGGCVVVLARPGVLGDRGWTVRPTGGAHVEFDNGT